MIGQEVISTPVSARSRLPDTASFKMSSTVRSRLSKQSRFFCGHCKEYLSRAAFWKHRRLYYDVHSERWTIKDADQHLEQEAKRPKRASDLSDDTSTNLWPSDSSGDGNLIYFFYLGGCICRLSLSHIAVNTRLRIMVVF